MSTTYALTLFGKSTIKSQLPTQVETRHTSSSKTGTTGKACQLMWKDMYVIVTPIDGLLAPVIRPPASSSLSRYQTAYGNTYQQTLFPLVRISTGTTMYLLLQTACQRNPSLFPITRRLPLRKQLPCLYTMCKGILGLQILLFQIEDRSLFQTSRPNFTDYLVLG